MAKTRLNVSLDSDLKERTGEVLAQMGLDYSTAVTVFFQQVVNHNKIPFEISAEKQWYTAAEVFGEDWREGLGDVEDDWE